MNKDDFQKIYDEGYWAALDAFGVWHDGKQYIGSPEHPITELFESRDTNDYYQINLHASWQEWEPQ